MNTPLTDEVRPNHAGPRRTRLTPNHRCIICDWQRTKDPTKYGLDMEPCSYRQKMGLPAPRYGDPR